MKVFLSSVISGYEQYRDAAAKGIEILGHNVIRAEDFSARPDPPQVVCLDGVRSADLVVLILGERYGYSQQSGLSATEEEYQEARSTGKDILIFVQQGVTRDEKAREFLDEVQAWPSGSYTASFATPDDLQAAVIESLHEFELARARGPVDTAEMLDRARQIIPIDRYQQGYRLCIAVAGGPEQQVLRPSELEDSQLEKDLQQMAIFGPNAIFSPSAGTKSTIHNGTLSLSQDNSALLLDEMGTIGVIQPARQEDKWRAVGGIPVLVEEEVRDAMERGLAFAADVLGRIDPVMRITDVVPVFIIMGAQYAGWKTEEEYCANPNSVECGNADEIVELRLSSPSRKRSSLRSDAKGIAEDITVLARRRWKP